MVNTNTRRVIDADKYTNCGNGMVAKCAPKPIYGKQQISLSVFPHAIIRNRVYLTQMKLWNTSKNCF